MRALCNYDVARAAAFGPRIGAWVTSQVGNGMNINVIGIGLWYHLVHHGLALRAGEMTGGTRVIDELATKTADATAGVTAAASARKRPRRIRMRATGAAVQVGS